MGPLPDIGPALTALAVFAAVGIVALVLGAAWAMWWLFMNVSITVA